MKNKVQVYAPKPYIGMSDLKGDITIVAKRLVDFPTEHKKHLAELKQKTGFKYNPEWDLINEYKIDIERDWEGIIP